MTAAAEPRYRGGRFRMLPIEANLQPGAASYVRAPGDDTYRPFALGIVRVEAGRIADMVAFHDPALFPAFGLPPTAPSPDGGEHFRKPRPSQQGFQPLTGGIMAKLIYTAITSLDGYIEDPGGKFDWAVPDLEVHGFVNDLEGPVGTYLYGRRMYETMAVWQSLGLDASSTSTEEAVERDYAELWRAADKVVYSATLDAVSTPRTRLERTFDPEAVRRLKDSTDRDLGIGGPALAQHAFAAGLVDQIDLFLHPVVVGGGKPGLPRGGRVDLDLLDERRFASGVVHLRYGRR